MQGDALLFWDLTPDAKEGDKYSLHAGCPVLRGTKWSATKWIHVRPFNVLPVDLPAQGSCRDDEMDCEDWAGGGECEKNPAFMVRTHHASASANGRQWSATSFYLVKCIAINATCMYACVSTYFWARPDVYSFAVLAFPRMGSQHVHCKYSCGKCENA